jgi:hypothetical protein
MENWRSGVVAIFQKLAQTSMSGLQAEAGSSQLFEETPLRGRELSARRLLSWDCVTSGQNL